MRPQDVRPTRRLQLLARSPHRRRASATEPGEHISIDEHTTDFLNEFLRMELGAMETYGLSLDRIRKPEPAKTLREIRDNHQMRGTLISTFLRTRGRVPVTKSGLGGRMTKLVQRGADLLGDKVALNALEEIEDRCLRSYVESVVDCPTGEATTLLEKELLPRQRRTQELCRTLRHLVV